MDIQIKVGLKYARDEDKIIKLEYLGQECIVRHTDYVPDFKIVSTEIKMRERKKNKETKKEEKSRE